MNHGCDLNVRICAKDCVSGYTELPLRRRVGSLARRLRASSLCIRFLFGLRAQWNWWFQETFSLLWWCCAIVFCICWDTLCNGTAALKRCVHCSRSWNLKEASHKSFVLISSTSGIWRMPRTKASSWIMDAIWMLGFARNIVFWVTRSFRCGEELARLRDGCGRRRFAFGSCSVCARSGTDGSRRLFLFFDDAVLLCFASVQTLCALELLHWRDAFTARGLGIWKKPRTKASFSHLQLLEFQGSLARKLRFHLFN